MIKIVSGSTIPVGSTVALVNLCNQFNIKDYECILYGPDRWHLDKCKSALLQDFKPRNNDIIIIHDISLSSASDVYKLPALVTLPQKNYWFTIFKSLMPQKIWRKPKPDQFMLVLTCQGRDISQNRLPRIDFYQKIHAVSFFQQISNQLKISNFICPNIVDDLKKSEHKPEMIAGIIGSICKQKNTAASIEKALQGGMETVIIYGYLRDPIYYYKEIEPLTRKYPGKIKFAGFIDNKQNMYNSISDVYCSVKNPWSMVVQECLLTNTRYHGPELSNNSEPMTNEQIFLVWKKELGL